MTTPLTPDPLLDIVAGYLYADHYATQHMGSTLTAPAWDKASEPDRANFLLTASILLVLLRESGRLLPPEAERPSTEWAVQDTIGHYEIWASESAAKTHAAAVKGALLYRKRWPQHVSKWLVP